MGSRTLLRTDRQRRDLGLRGLTDAQLVRAPLRERREPRGERGGDDLLVEALRLSSAPCVAPSVADDDRPVAAVLGVLAGASPSWVIHKPLIPLAFPLRCFSDIAMLDGWFRVITKLSMMSDIESRGGRPRKTHDEKRDVQKPVRFSRIEAREVELAADFEGVALAAWARRVLLRAARAVNGGAR